MVKKIKPDGSYVLYIGSTLEIEKNSDGTLPTDKLFTGQRAMEDLGIYFYNARFYSPSLGRFLSADTMVPGGANSQAYDRYSYTENNPIKNTDSSGHCIDGITTIPCLLALIAVAGFAGGAAVYEYNVSGNSWWVSSEDAWESFTAGMDGATAAITLADIAVTAAVTGSFAIETLKSQSSSFFSGFKSVPSIGGDPENFLQNSSQEVERLPDEAFVCRAGECLADSFSRGTGVKENPDGTLDGISVRSAPGISIEELTNGFKNKQIGVTTVGNIRSLGGEVIQSGSINNPYHADLSGITAEQAERLFTPTIQNSWWKPRSFKMIY